MFMALEGSIRNAPWEHQPQHIKQQYSFCRVQTMCSCCSSTSLTVKIFEHPAHASNRKKILGFFSIQLQHYQPIGHNLVPQDVCNLSQHEMHRKLEC